MLKYLYLVLLATADDRPYNILTIDGGGIKGIITATCISEMEKFAYQYGVVQMKYSKMKLYMNNGQKRERIPMKDLFDMLSGTSTGSILSGGLSIGKNGDKEEPMFWADDIRSIYELDAEKKIFKKTWWKTALNYLIPLLIFAIFIIVFYLIGKWRYDNPKIKIAQKEMLEFLRDAKDRLVEEKQEETKLEDIKTRLIVD